jgi:uncharacterized protein YecE (DUF72 family)
VRLATVGHSTAHVPAAPGRPAGVSPPAREARHPVRVGCSGWQYADWREAFYPKGLPQRRWLEHYARVFDTVEVNSTFYRLAKRDAVARWVEQTPSDFTFAVKGSRYLTHMKRLTDTDRGIHRFYDPLAPMIEAGKLGPVLWQLPDSFQRDTGRLADFLRALPAGAHAVELRHRSWLVEEVFEVLRAYGVALVVGDRAGRPEDPFVETADFGFVRFHHGRRGRGGNYSRAELESWAERLDEWRRRVPFWIYFNNDWSAYAPRNALDLRQMLSRAAVA